MTSRYYGPIGCLHESEFHSLHENDTVLLSRISLVGSNSRRLVVTSSTIQQGIRILLSSTGGKLYLSKEHEQSISFSALPLLTGPVNHRLDMMSKYSLNRVAYQKANFPIFLVSRFASFCLNRLLCEPVQRHLEL